MHTRDEDLHWYMWGGATEETKEMLSTSRPLPSSNIVGVPVAGCKNFDFAWPIVRFFFLIFLFVLLFI